jgi:hypothetical protein
VHREVRHLALVPAHRLEVLPAAARAPDGDGAVRRAGEEMGSGAAAARREEAQAGDGAVAGVHEEPQVLVML